MDYNICPNGGGIMDLSLRRRFMVEETKKPSRLPEEYQEVEYITIINNSELGYKNKISLQSREFGTSIAFNQVDKIDFKISLDEQRTNSMLFSAWTGTGAGATPFIYLRASGTISDSGSDISFNAVGTPVFDGTPFEVALENLATTTTSRYIAFGAWMDATYSATMNWYYVNLYKNGLPIAELVPCYRKSDGQVGFYDLVSGNFAKPHDYSNASAFVVGAEV